MKEVKKKVVPKPKKQIDPVTFEAVVTEEIEETGEHNLPALDLDQEALDEIMSKQAADDSNREANRNQTKMFGNDVNEWKLIQKTYNDNLDWEHVTTAMRVGNRGIIVHVKEAIGQKVNATSVFIDNGKLVEVKGKWVIQ